MYSLGEGGKIKGFGDGEENQKGKKEKKRKLGGNITFGCTKSLILISKIQFKTI